MPDSEIKDEITYSQSLIKEITDEETVKLFEDNNLLLVLKFMRENNDPMTAEEIEAAFQKKGKDKSVKTIYRYLKILKKAGLVVKAGKRISPSDKKLKTQILFLRSAKIFLPIGKIIKKDKTDEEKRQEEIKITIISRLLELHIGRSLKSLELFDEMSKTIIDRRYEIYRRILQDTNDEITNSVIKLDWKCIEEILKKTSLLALILDQKNWREELLKSFM